MLYRSVQPSNIYWQDGEITSALFKDSKGVSVDRGNGRAEESIIERFIKTFGESNVKAVACLPAAVCYENDILVLSKPLPDNEYHAEIHHSAEKPTLTKSQARKLAKACRLMKAKEEAE